MAASLPHLRIAILLGLFAVAGYLALHHALLAVGRRGLRVGRWLALWSLLSMGFLGALLAQVTTSDVSRAAWALRGQVVFSAFLPTVLLGAVHALVGLARPPRVALYLLAGAALATLTLVTPWVVRDEGRPFEDALGLVYPWVEVGPAFSLVGLLGFVALVDGWRVLGRMRGVPSAHARRLRITLALYAAMGLWDVAIALFDWRTLPLFQFAIVLLAAAFGALSVVHLREQSEELERGVAHRTRDLAAANEELSRALEASRAADEARQLFLARMSHELRTPLNAVAGSLELIERRGPREDQREGLRAAREGADALLRDITDLLEYVRLESTHELAVSSAPLEPRVFFADLVEEHRGAADARGLTLSLSVEEGVPARVVVDAHRLGQTTTILLENAIEFTDRGAVSVQVSAEARALRVSVTDTGPGIDAESLARIFEPLVTLDSSMSRAHGGQGLGLSLLKVIVERMGGEVEVRSERGRGSTFSFVLPLEELDEGVGDGRPSRELPAVVRDDAGRFAPGTRVLVVEDVALNRAVLCAMLRELGVESVVAEDGARALEVHGRDPALDAILMDCQMPVLDGYEATRRIRERERTSRHTPILAVTAHALPEEHERAFASGMDHVLTKPITIRDLTRALRRFVPSRFVASAPEPAAEVPPPRGPQRSTR